MSRLNSHETPCSAGRPRRPKEVVSLAPAAANRMSAKHISTNPTPAAGPFTAAMTGLESRIASVGACSAATSGSSAGRSPATS